MAVYPIAGTANDSKIVLAGAVIGNWDFALARYHPNGSLDTSFGSGGKVTTNLGLFQESVADVVIQPDGKILVVGSCDGPARILLARYNANGSLDATFGSGGKVVSALGGADDSWASAVALQADGRIVVASTTRGDPNGDGPGQFTVARYNPNGNLDLTFGANHTGYVLLPLAGANGYSGADGVIVQPDGKIVAVGEVGVYGTHNAWALARFNADGTLDDGSALDGTPLDQFGSGGVVITDLPGSGDDRAQAVAVQADGKIVVAGVHDFSNSSGQKSFALGRYTAGGSLDVNFNSTGLVTTRIGTGSIGRDLALQPSDGKLVVAGEATIGSTSDFAVARYLGDSPTGPLTVLRLADPGAALLLARPAQPAAAAASAITVENIAPQGQWVQLSSGFGDLERIGKDGTRSAVRQTISPRATRALVLDALFTGGDVGWPTFATGEEAGLTALG
jgi:uncharacterized delta-60 repeat protein